MFAYTVRWTARRIARAVLGSIALLVAFGTTSSADTAPGGAVELALLVENSAATRDFDPDRRLVDLTAELVRHLGPDARIALLAYDDLVSPLLPLTTTADAGGEAVRDELQALEFSARHSNSAAGLERAIYELTAVGRPGAEQGILLLQAAAIESGKPSQDGAFRRWAMEVLAKKAADAGIAVHVISLGANPDLPLAEALADRTSGVALHATSVAELSRAMGVVAGRLAPTVPATDAPALAAPSETKAAQLEPAPTPARSTSPSPGPDPLPREVPTQPPAADAEPVQRPRPAGGPVPPRGAAEPYPAAPGTVWTPPGILEDRQNLLMVAAALLVVCLSGGVAWYLLRRRGAARHRRSDVPASEGKARLIDVSGVTGKGVYVISGKLARISRSAGPDTANVVTIQIPRDVISRSHAFIEQRRGSYWITDPGSDNGTFVNDARITGSRQLKHGDRIQFANFEFLFEQPSQHELSDPQTTAYAAPSAAAAPTVVVDAPRQIATQMRGAETSVDTGKGHSEVPESRGATRQAAGSQPNDPEDRDPTIVRPAR